MRRSRLYLPLFFAVILVAAYFVIQRQPLIVSELGDIREALFGKELRYLLFAVFAAFIFLFVRFIDAIVFDYFLRKRTITAPLILRQIVSVALYLLLFAWAISVVFQYSVTALLTTTTVVAAVIGLALQDTLGNLFSGISLHLERPFDVGDVIRLGDFAGVVESVNWRATRVRGFSNQIIVLPNSQIARDRLEVYPRNNLNARTVTVGISYDVPPSQAIRVLAQAAGNIDGVSNEIPALARVASFGDSAVNYDVKYWTRSYHHRDTIDAELRRAIWYALRRNRMSIPYPIRTLQRLAPADQTGAIETEEIVRRLRAVDFLQPLSDDEMMAIARGSEVHLYSRGETILKQGDAGDSMFVIDRGTVSVRVTNEGGPKEVARLSEGSVFGEMALLTGESRTADIVAAADAVVIEIGKESLQPVLVSNPDLVAAISNRVTERREGLVATTTQSQTAQTTMLRRIRSYFGL